MPHTDTVTHVMTHPGERIFAALLDADARAVWLPPPGMHGEVTWFDPRPGGGYRMILSHDDPPISGKSTDGTDVVDVRFAEITPPHRVVEEAAFASDDPAFAGTMTMTWTIDATADGSRITVAAANVPDGIDRVVHEEAISATLMNLDRFLAAR